MEARSLVYWLVSTLYFSLVDCRFSEEIIEIIFWKSVGVKETITDAAEAKARPTGHPRTVTGSCRVESCTEACPLTKFTDDTLASVRSSTSSISDSAKDFNRSCHQSQTMIAISTRNELEKQMGKRRSVKFDLPSPPAVLNDDSCSVTPANLPPNQPGSHSCRR